jgi:hypothetical protein
MPTSHHLAAALCAVAAAACFRADVAPCTATCAASSDCPAGLACTAAGLCAESAATVCGGGPDAGPDAVTGTLDVTVRDVNGLPAIGVRVLAARPDGTPVDDTTTGGDGTATVSAPGVVDVTVVHTDGLGSDLTTIVAAAPGDHLVFGPDPHAPPTTMQTVIWPTDSGSFRYLLASSCDMTPQSVDNIPGQPTQTASIVLDPTCAGDHDVLIVDFDQFATFRHYLFAAGNAGPDITLTGSWQPYADATANLQQLPTGVTVPGGFTIVASTVLRAGDLARGASLLTGVTGGGGGANALVPLPPVGSGREMLVTAFHDDDTHRVESIVERIPVAGEYNLSVEPAMVPWVTSPAVIDATARTIRWTQLDAGPSAGPGDMVALDIEYMRGSTYFAWRIAAPIAAVTATGGPGEYQLAVPDLPGSEPFELLPTDTVSVKWMRIYGFTGGDYAAVRGRAGAGLAFFADPYAATDTFFVDPAITRIARSHYAM